MTGPRMALAALSALAAAAVFTAPATATAFENGISVQPYAHIGDDGTVTLSGTYVCNDPSPVGAVQLSTAVTQDGTRLGTGNGDVKCDGEEHAWETTASLRFTKGIHAGQALGEARLQVVHLQGLMPKSVDTVAEDRHEIELIDHR
ncbi:DUF6299 family protein [Streptomyces sp. APSN-46.1]|uniref:DUF6299 family protein n=1 Tax=Streptomyces sp. APSN-46.1 TaxID=2929049 RepID=UPI001FB3856C|nr:DUF6299 family protein [Streptomyces sp. APSN-46.1]MCJ1679055.1 DUF6299 family protein [Streptomyces sp. APSN-46.1]